MLVDNLQSVSQENITNVVITLANLARNTETHPLVRGARGICIDIPLPCVTKCKCSLMKHIRGNMGQRSVTDSVARVAKTPR